MKSIFTSLLIAFLVLAQNTANCQVSEFLGLAKHGGSDSMGVIFKTDSVGQNHEVLYNFKIDYNGIIPNWMIDFDYYHFIGTTSSGINGAGSGTIFSYNHKDDQLVERYRFTMSGDVGYKPVGRIVKASDSKVYGTTSYGTEGFRGGIYEFNPNTNNCKLLHVFRQNDGTGHSAGLIQLAGKLYGTCNTGGAKGQGTLFEFDITKDSFRVLHHFNGLTGGARPFGELQRINNNQLIGTTQLGGKDNDGTLFIYDLLTEKYTSVFEFKENESGLKPRGLLLNLYNGLIIGKTEGNSSTSPSLFSYQKTNGAVKQLFTLDKDSFPQGKILTYTETRDGKLLVVIYDRIHRTVMYEYDYSNQDLSAVVKLNSSNYNGISSDPSAIVSNSTTKLYLLSDRGGAAYKGSIVSVELPNKQEKLLTSFGNASGGAQPVGGLLEYANDTFYGLTSSHGMFYGGTLFKFTTSDNKYHPLISFNKEIGMGLTTDLFKAENGKLYGAISYQEKYGRASVFEFNPANNELKVIMPLFNSLNIIGISEGAKNQLYLLSSNGANYQGIYRYDLNIDSSWQVVNFKTASILTGINPKGQLLKVGNNSFFGLCTEGGLDGLGILYEYNTKSDSLIKQLDFTAAAGFKPLGNLIAGNNQNLYFLAENQGTFLMEYHLVNKTLISVFEFNTRDRVIPQNIILGRNGKIYGLAKAKDEDGNDLVFEIDLKTQTLNHQYWITKKEDGRVDENALLEVQKGTSVSRNEALTSHFQVYPSLSEGIVQIEGFPKGPVILTIADLNGRVVQSSIILSEGKEQIHTLQLTPLPKGIYLLSFNQEGNTISKKIVLH